MGSKLPTPGMQTISSVILVKVTSWFDFIYSSLFVLVDFFNGVLFLTYDIFSLRRVGFGQ